MRKRVKKRDSKGLWSVNHKQRLQPWASFHDIYLDWLWITSLCHVLRRERDKDTKGKGWRNRQEKKEKRDSVIEFSCWTRIESNREEYLRLYLLFFVTVDAIFEYELFRRGRCVCCWEWRECLHTKGFVDGSNAEIRFSCSVNVQRIYREYDRKIQLEIVYKQVKQERCNFRLSRLTQQVTTDWEYEVTTVWWRQKQRVSFV